MRTQRPDKIVLIGMMGSGKSTVGRILAERTGATYVDNDDGVRALTGREPEDVIAMEGEESLHAVEAQALLRALSLDGPMVIAAAAWVVLDAGCREALRREPDVVYLRARAETLRARIGSGSGRRRDATDAEWLERRADERDDLYRAVATMIVNVDGRTPDEVAGTILERD